jgi:hypothetical protein
MRQSLPLMHFYSGKLLQFYSGVDSGSKSALRIPTARKWESSSNGIVGWTS